MKDSAVTFLEDLFKTQKNIEDDNKKPRKTQIIPIETSGGLRSALGLTRKIDKIMYLPRSSMRFWTDLLLKEGLCNTRREALSYLVENNVYLSLRAGEGEEEDDTDRAFAIVQNEDILGITFVGDGDPAERLAGLGEEDRGIREPVRSACGSEVCDRV